MMRLPKFEYHVPLTLAEAAHANHKGALLQAGRNLTPPRRK